MEEVEEVTEVAEEVVEEMEEVVEVAEEEAMEEEVEWWLTVFEWEQGESFRAGFEDMDPALWSRLPEGVLYDVVCKLPIKCYVRFMAVSKLWKHLLARGGVLGQRKCVSHLGSQPVPGADLAPLAQLGMRMERVLSLPLPVPEKYLSVQTGDLKFGASHRGVLCFFSLPDDGSIELFICYPMTRMWDALPAIELPGDPEQTPTIFMDDTRIFVVKLRYVQVYSRRQGFWRPLIDIPDMDEPHTNFILCEKHGKPVMCKGVIYQVTFGCEYEVHFVDLKEKDYVGEIRMCNEVGPFWLVEHNGSVYYSNHDQQSDSLWLSCVLINPKTEDYEAVCSDRDTEHGKLSLRFLDELATGESKAVSLFDTILLCANSYYSGYLVPLHISKRTCGVHISTSRAQALTISGLFRFAPDWTPSRACRSALH